MSRTSSCERMSSVTVWTGKLTTRGCPFKIEFQTAGKSAPPRAAAVHRISRSFAVSTTASSRSPSGPLQRLLYIRHGVVERQSRSARAALSCLSSGRFEKRYDRVLQKRPAYKVILPRGDRGERARTHVKKLTRKQTLYRAMSLAAHQGKSSLASVSRTTSLFPLSHSKSTGLDCRERHLVREQMAWSAASILHSLRCRPP